MHEDTGVAKATVARVLVVLADGGRIVEARGDADMRRVSQWSYSDCVGVCFVVVQPRVGVGSLVARQYFASFGQCGIEREGAGCGGGDDGRGGAGGGKGGAEHRGAGGGSGRFGRLGIGIGIAVGVGRLAFAAVAAVDGAGGDCFHWKLVTPL